METADVPSRGDLTTIATTAINAEYAERAREGLTEFDRMLSGGFDWGSFAVALAGNLIWAAACFETGGAAFLTSVTGIGLGSVSPLAVTDRDSFHQFGSDTIDAVVNNLLERVDAVTSDVHRQATEQGWDDRKARKELLARLLKPEFTRTVSGGIQVVNGPAIRQRTVIELLQKANESKRLHEFAVGGGYFTYRYRVRNHYRESGWWIFSSEDLTPLNQWQFTPGETSLRLPRGGTPAVDAFRRESVIEPADLPFNKLVVIDSEGADGRLELYLDGDNTLWNHTYTGVFTKLWGSGESRLTKLLAELWRASDGRPPSVRGANLGGGS